MGHRLKFELHYPAIDRDGCAPITPPQTSMVELLISPTANQGLTSYDAATADRPRIDLLFGSHCLGRHRHLYLQRCCFYFFKGIRRAAVYPKYYCNSIIASPYVQGSTSHMVMSRQLCLTYIFFSHGLVRKLCVNL